MFFKNITGQKEIKQKLIQGVREQRISHAQLFTGEESFGGLPLIIAYAQFLLCENPSKFDEGDSCGDCSACKKVSRIIHPDVHFVFPVVRTDKFKQPVSDNYIEKWREKIAENAYFSLNQWLDFIGTGNQQGSIYAHENDEIIKKLSYKSFESEYKIMIIWMAEKMNATLANKLLKIFEEPYPKTLFLLLAADTDSMLPTILSRMQLIKLMRIPERDIYESLQKSGAADESTIRDAVRISHGSYINALEALKSSEHINSNFEQFTQLMRLCYQRNVPGILSWAEEIAKTGREHQKDFLSYALRMIRANFMLNNTQEDITALTQQEMEFSKKFHPYIHENNVEKINDELNKAYYHIERNANHKILFTDLSFKLAGLLKV